MNEKKKSFVLYTDYKKHLDLLTNEEKGILFDALFRYVTGEKVELSGKLEMAFSFISANIDRDTAKYEETCEKRKISGSMGGKANASKCKQMLANASKCKQTVANVADTDNDTDTDTDNDNDTDKVTDIQKVRYQQIVDAFNETCVSLPHVNKLTDKRKRAIKSALTDFTVDEIKECFSKAEQSDFLTGKSKDWKAGFDWLINKANIVKVLEGNYDNSKKTFNNSKNTFNNFQQTGTDYDALLEKIKIN